jgi:16S rRNA (uracil1498-N3)-methyltransferase
LGAAKVAPFLLTIHDWILTIGVVARRRFIADEVVGATAVLTGQNAAHLARVLRARVGQEYEVVVDGVARLARVLNVREDRVELELGAEIYSSLGVPITMVIAIFKFDRFEWAIEKATELGASRIVPVIARRTDAHLVQAAVKRVQRWTRIAHEAAQQSRRTLSPEITQPLKLKDAVSLDAGLKVLCAESEEQTTIRDALASRSGAAGVHSIVLAVGPEGGWTEEEVRLFIENGWISVTLGPTILRAETAVIAAIAVAASLAS